MDMRVLRDGREVVLCSHLDAMLWLGGREFGVHVCKITSHVTITFPNV